MRVLRRLIALLVYASLLLPMSEHRLTMWMKAVEVTATSLDRTMRRRRSQIESDRLTNLFRLLKGWREDIGERTMRRCA